MVAPEAAVDGCSSSAEGVAPNTETAKLAHKVIVLSPLTNTFFIWFIWFVLFIWLIWFIWSVGLSSLPDSSVWFHSTKQTRQTK
jgi:hypothetical protein